MALLKNLLPKFGNEANNNAEKSVSLGDSQESNFYFGSDGIDKISLSFDNDGFLCYLSIKGKKRDPHEFKGDKKNFKHEKIRSFKDDEYLICIRGTTSGVKGHEHTGTKFITGLAFVTNKEELGPFGSLVGEPFTETADPFSGIIQFRMRAFGKRIVSIDQPQSRKIPSDLHRLPNKSGVFGGLGGKYWDTKPDPKSVISHITIYYTQDAVHAISITEVDDGKKPKTTCYGHIPHRCDRKEVDIGANEYIRKVKGTFGVNKSNNTYVVNSLSIHTNLKKGGMRERKAGEGDKVFKFKEKDAAIVGFHGDEDNVIKAIGVYYKYRK